MTGRAPSARRYHLGLLGFPVAHSASPSMHQAALRAAGLAGGYELWPVESVDALRQHLERVRSGAVDGVNVTIPWKVEVADRCDRLVGWARDVRAVNTLVRGADGALEGHNTDVPGLAASVVESFPAHDFNGASVAVIGAGGAARSAILAAELLGARDTRVFNRNVGRAQEVVAELGRGQVVADLDAALDGVRLVLQASAWGFNLGADETECAAGGLSGPLRRMASDGAVYDLVYKPSPTAWMVAARRNGRASVDGLGMLAHQAALAFERWTGVTPDVPLMLAAARRHLEMR